MGDLILTATNINTAKKFDSIKPQIERDSRCSCAYKLSDPYKDWAMG